MFQTALPTTTLFEASLEIGIILAGTFILGMMLGWIIKPSQMYGEDILENIPEIKPSYALTKKSIKTKTLLPEGDDFKIIEGITPKVEKFLLEHGIKTFEDIVREDVAGLEALLLEGGTSFQRYSPVNWPDQARLAQHGKWTELEEYQEILRSNGK